MAGFSYESAWYLPRYEVTLAREVRSVSRDSVDAKKEEKKGK